MENNKTTIVFNFNWLILLSLIFVLLRYLGYINWEWYWLLCPILFPLSIACLAVISFIAIIIFILICKIVIAISECTHKKY